MFVSDNNFDIVNNSLAGLREVDEQTQASLEILGERLESLKKTSSLFAGVSFSRDVKRLASHIVVVG